MEKGQKIFLFILCYVNVGLKSMQGFPVPLHYNLSTEDNTLY